MLWPAFHFHSVLLIFVNLWPISTLCVADMVCGRYRLWPISSFRFSFGDRLPVGLSTSVYHDLFIYAQVGKAKNNV